MIGYIHSTDSFGTVDGPGVRFLVFMQGCPMRCLYCHNPDTWQIGTGTQMTVDEILELYHKNSGFYKHGGITVTGGEPLLQIDFVTELFRRAREIGIHTCIDTSGITFNPQSEASLLKHKKLLAVTSLVMLDIKHIDTEHHKRLTGHSNENILAFASLVSDSGVDLWIRHVVVDGYTTDPVYQKKLGEFIATLKTVKALDVLAYHTMGKAKYKSMGLDYPLGDLPPLDGDKLKAARDNIISAFRDRRAQLIRDGQFDRDLKH